MRRLRLLILPLLAVSAGCGEGEPAEPLLPPVAKACRGVAHERMPVAGGRAVAEGEALRAVYRASHSNRPCYLRARRIRRGHELVLFAAAPRVTVAAVRRWCVQTPLPERMRRRLLLTRERDRTPGDGRVPAAGRGCVAVPVLAWRKARPHGPVGSRGPGGPRIGQKRLVAP